MRLPAFAAATAALLLWQCACAMPHAQHQSPDPGAGGSYEASRLFELPEYDTAQIANQMSLQQIASGSRYLNVPNSDIPPIMRLGAGQAKRARIILDLSYLARQLNPRASAFHDDAFILKLKTEYADGHKYVNYYEAQQATRAAMSLLSNYGTIEDSLFYDQRSLKGMAWCTRDFLTRGKIREEHARGLDGVAGAFRRGFLREGVIRKAEIELWQGGISAREALAREHEADLLRNRVCDDLSKNRGFHIWARGAGEFCAQLIEPALDEPEYVLGATGAGAVAGFASGLGLASIASAAAGAMAGAAAAVADLWTADSERRGAARKQIELARERKADAGMESLSSAPASLPEEVLSSRMAKFRRLLSSED